MAESRSVDGEEPLSLAYRSGMLHASTVRAPVSRGNLASVSVPRLPGGYRLVLPEDIPGSNRIVSFGSAMPILATGQFVYRGEPLALVAGPDPAVADELAGNAKIEYEELEPVCNWETFSSQQVVAKRIVTMGDPVHAFETAARTETGTYRTESLDHHYSEPAGALAYFDYDRMAVRCSTQWPYHVRDSVVEALGCRSQDVTVLPSKLGIHLEGKLWFPSLVACHAAICASRCRAPVRILYTRMEDFLASPKRARASITVASALDEGETLTGLDIQLSINVGAYSPLAAELLDQAIVALTCTYRCEHVRIEGYAVTSNTVPLGSLGGLGASHSFYAMESHTSRIASTAGENPVSWKSRNLVVRGSSILGGSPVRENLPFGILADRVTGRSDFFRKYAAYEHIRRSGAQGSGEPKRGIGISFACQNGVFFLQGLASNAYAMEATLDKNLVHAFRSSASVAGSPQTDLWRERAVSVLGIAPESIVFSYPSTATTPNSGPLTAARIPLVERLIARCCVMIQRRRFREPLPITVRSVHRVGNPARWSEGRISGNPLDGAFWGCAVVEAELDDRTATILPRGVWIAASDAESQEDAPERPDHPGLRRFRASTIDALGSCMNEWVDPSTLAPEDYFSYSRIAPGSYPSVDAGILSRLRQPTAHGFEDIPFNTIPAAFRNAAAQAAGVDLWRLPVRPADLRPGKESP